MSKLKVVVLAFCGLGLLAGWQWVKERGKWAGRVKALEVQVSHTDSLRVLYSRDSLEWIKRDSLSSQVALHASQEARRAKILLKTTLDSLRGDSLALEQADTLSDLQFDGLPYPARVLILSQAKYIQQAQRALEQSKGVQEGQEQEIGALRGAQGDFRARIASLETMKTRLTSERDSARVLLSPPSPFSLTFELGVGPGCAVNLGQAVCGLSVQATLVRFRLSK